MKRVKNCDSLYVDPPADRPELEAFGASHFQHSCARELPHRNHGCGRCATEWRSDTPGAVKLTEAQRAVLKALLWAYRLAETGQDEGCHTSVTTHHDVVSGRSAATLERMGLVRCRGYDRLNWKAYLTDKGREIAEVLR